MQGSIFFVKLYLTTNQMHTAALHVGSWLSMKLTSMVGKGSAFYCIFVTVAVVISSRYRARAGLTGANGSLKSHSCEYNNKLEKIFDEHVYYVALFEVSHVTVLIVSIVVLTGANVV